MENPGTVVAILNRLNHVHGKIECHDSIVLYLNFRTLASVEFSKDTFPGLQYLWELARILRSVLAIYSFLNPIVIRSNPWLLWFWPTSSLAALFGAVAIDGFINTRYAMLLTLKGASVEDILTGLYNFPQGGKAMEYKVPDDLLYVKDHDWAKVEGDVATFGITDYAQQALSDIVYVELPEVGQTVEKGASYGTIEAVKAVADLIAPLSGEVIEVNEALNDDPSILNKDPYGEGWIVKVKLSNPDEAKELMSAEEYRKYLEEIA